MISDHRVHAADVVIVIVAGDRRNERVDTLLFQVKNDVIPPTRVDHDRLTTYPDQSGISLTDIDELDLEGVLRSDCVLSLED